MYKYDGIITQNLPFAYYLNSESLNENLISALPSDVDNEISTRGLGTLAEKPKAQEIHFINLLSPSSDVENSTDFENALEFNPFTYGFIYGENLYNIPDDSPTYYVCLNQGESSYYRTSGTDCDGVTIDTDYTSGRKPARFLDGQCCNTLCDDFSITVTNTSPKDAYKNNDAKGSLKVKVSGGTADFTYAIDTQGVAIASYISVATKASDAREYEFTGIALKESTEYPFKVTVTDANQCQKIAYVHLNKDNVSQPGLILGCTDVGAVNYDSGADLNSGCLWCVGTGSRGETYNSLSFGLTSLSQVRTLGLDLITPQSTKVTHATASGNSDGQIFFRGEVFPAAVSSIDLDADATYRVRRYNLGNGENSNQLTKGEILALSAASTATGLTSPTISIGSLAPGWYALAVDVQNITSLQLCISVFRFKVGYGGCTDSLATNYDQKSSYDSSTCMYDCPSSTENITITNTENPCIKTVSVAARKKNDVINWNIGNKHATGPGPHVVAVEEYVTVYRENSHTKCTSSGEVYIDPTDCNVNLNSVTARSGLASQYEQIQVNSGGCTDETSFNFDCNALWDNGACVEAVFGCTSNTALNINSNANVDDGSCIEGIAGCCDQTAVGYNPLANICIPGLCGDNLLTAPEWGGISIGGLTLGPQTTNAFGPDCPTNTAALDITATSPNLTLGVLYFGTPNAQGSAVLIPTGVEINAYKIPIGGLTEGGYSVNDLIFPMATSGWPVAATWILTGSGRPSGILGFNADLLYNANDEIEGVLNATDMLNNFTSLTSFANIPANSGTIGYGAYILEITVPSAQGITYGRLFVNSPANCTANGFVNGVGPSTADGSGSTLIGCTDPTASNYNPQTTLNLYTAANVGFPESYNSFGSGFLMDYLLNDQGGFFSNGIDANGGFTTASSPDDLTANLCSHNMLTGIDTQGFSGSTDQPGGIGFYGLPCIPPNMDRKIDYIDACMNNGLVNWYNNLITGRDTKCETRDISIMSMIRYLLSRQGLECIFNCSDSGTLSPSTKTCESMWENGGSRSWIYNTTTGQGNNDLYGGQVWKMDFAAQAVLPWMGDAAPNTYWMLNRVVGAGDASASDLDSVINPYGIREKVNFKLCVDEKKITESINYLDNFFKFASKYCANCSPCSYNSRNKTSFISDSPNIITSTGVSDSTNLSVGGISLTINEDDIN